VTEGQQLLQQVCVVRREARRVTTTHISDPYRAVVSDQKPVEPVRRLPPRELLGNRERDRHRFLWRKRRALTR
jgi:hypothetical protein